MSKKKDKIQSLPVRNENDNTLRVAIAVVTLGMTMGVNPSKSLAIPVQAEQGEVDAVTTLAGSGQTQKIGGLSTDADIKAERVAEVFEKIEPPEVTNSKVVESSKPAAVYQKKIERPEAAYPKFFRPEATSPNVERPAKEFYKTKPAGSEKAQPVMKRPDKGFFKSTPQGDAGRQPAMEQPVQQVSPAGSAAKTAPAPLAIQPKPLAAPAPLGVTPSGIDPGDDGSKPAIKPLSTEQKDKM
jgi:hypothetical protein